MTDGYINPPPYSLIRGEGRLIISVPHAGTFIPAGIAARLTPEGRAVLDTDWHVDKLYAFAPALGATLLVATHSRTVVDLNRAPGGDALYPGQAETAICPTETFDGAPLYAGAAPEAAEVAARVAALWQPYHTALAAELARIKACYGHARLLDGHSIRSIVPRLFTGTLPDLNFGTNGGASADPALVARALQATAPGGFSQVLDGRFRGGHITRFYGRPAEGVHAIQLELAQSTYLDETEPHRFVAERTIRLTAALSELVKALLAA